MADGKGREHGPNELTLNSRYSKVKRKLNVVMRGNLISLVVEILFLTRYFSIVEVCLFRLNYEYTFKFVVSYLTIETFSNESSK